MNGLVNSNEVVRAQMMLNMDPPLHSRIETTSETVGRTRWNCTKRPKTQQSAEKLKAFVFWGSSSVLSIDYSQKALLNRLKKTQENGLMC